MANLQWLKLSTNFFDNNKIKLLESEKDGDMLIRVWIQLLTIAMKCNYQGRLSLTEDKPMTADEFSKIPKELTLKSSIFGAPVISILSSSEDVAYFLWQDFTR